MRIYTKIQLVVELNLVFYGFINVTQTHPKPEVKPVHGVSSFNMMVYQVVNHNNIQPVVEF